MNSKTSKAPKGPTPKAATARWTCVGSVRGGCGIAHQSRAAAEGCCSADNAACRSLPGGKSYSDRYPEPANESARKEEAERKAA